MPHHAVFLATRSTSPAAALAWVILLAHTALAGAEPLALDAQGRLSFELVEPIASPSFAWPRSVLTWRVAYDAASSAPGRWMLRDEAGLAVPFQAWDRHDGRSASCNLSFASDLPSGARRRYRLETLAAAAEPASPPSPASVVVEEEGLVLGTGRLRVRVPRSGGAPTGAPGPFLGFDDGRGWIGTSRLVVPGRAVQTWRSEVVESGPLVARVRLAYGLAGGGSYTVTLTALQGADHLLLAEEMAGLPADGAARVEIAWSGFQPTHRRGNEPIAGPRVLTDRGEDPAFVGPSRVEDAAVEMLVRVAPSAVDRTICTPWMDFTDRPGRRELGVAVHGADGWDDRGYALWTSGSTLALRFRLVDGLLSWTLPLADGTRGLALVLGEPTGGSLTAAVSDRAAGLGLDLVKDWDLTYADPRPRSPPDPQAPRELAQLRSRADYLRALWAPANPALDPGGDWTGPVGLRALSSWIVPGFARFRDEFTPEERARATALLLFLAHDAAREEVGGMRRLLAGHPNFMVDWKFPLLAAAWLFPAHPRARAWADQYERLIGLLGAFHVRPPVAAWGALGGRWTESIATYNWAFLEPAVHATRLGRLFDGRERLADPGMALHAGYLVGIASAPVRLGSDAATAPPAGLALTPANGFQRIHPPQGAHASRRAVPAAAAGLAEALMRYRPMAAQHLLWLAQRPGAAEADHGTNPRLVSAKYTGYGIVLRAAVDTPDEIAVVLQQIDQGPNYRWGFANEGGCGDLAYYAAGRSFSGHLGEDAGDRRLPDAEATCNTGVYRDRAFRGIGMNDLTAPFYDLGTAQFAELLPRSGTVAQAYSWPEYRSRALLLVGADYLLTCDGVDGCSRTVWTTVEGQDAEPQLIPLRGETAFRVESRTSGRGHAAGSALSRRFDCYKGGGDRLLLVSHRDGLAARLIRLGGSEAVEVTLPGGLRDVVVMQREAVDLRSDAVVLSGRAGVVRRGAQGALAFALFHGRRIGADGYELAVDREDLGVSAEVARDGDLAGRCVSPAGGTLTVTRPAGQPAVRAALDGQELPAALIDGVIQIVIPPGEHHWQLTAGAIVPMPAAVAHSVALADGVRLAITPVASATGYRIERSDDTGLTWRAVGDSAGPAFELRGIAAPVKLHLRVVALNGAVAARPGPDHPVYVTGVAVPPPAGLRVLPGDGVLSASWGEVLGASGYRLYRQLASDGPWSLLYDGPATAWSGASANVRFAVSAVDGIGEGARGEVVEADPGSWRSFLPPVPLVFRRQTAYMLPPYAVPGDLPPAAYPQ